MNKELLHYIRLFDSISFRISSRLFQEKNSLMVFAFHGLFRNENEKSLNLVDPRLWITYDDFLLFVEYYLNHDYLFVSPDDIINGLKNNAKYILITFDDGYFNNQNVLPILKKYGIPAIFFVSINHLKDNKCFWWDVLYREGIKMGMSIKEIDGLRSQLKKKKSEKCEQHLKDLFGENIYRPVCDIDRPFTLEELIDFSLEKLVFIGNHTSNHEILSHYCVSEIKSSILTAQDGIHNLIGLYPKVIAYPNGVCSKEIIEISKDIGFKLGFTTQFKKTQLPIDYSDDNSMRLGRFDFYDYSDKKELLLRCKIFRSNIAISNSIIKVSY